jgi:hypothetical protein
MSKREVLMALCYYTSEMACPYFDPIERRSNACAGRDAMLPLGDSWAGLCRAIPDQPAPPDDASLRTLCNLGYARGHCSRFPADDGPDAVRFTIARDAGSTLGIAYVVERDHHPYTHGRLDYQAATGTLADGPSDLLARQALAYVASYHRRKTA